MRKEMRKIEGIKYIKLDKANIAKGKLSMI